MTKKIEYFDYMDSHQTIKIESPGAKSITLVEETRMVEIITENNDLVLVEITNACEFVIR